MMTECFRTKRNQLQQSVAHMLTGMGRSLTILLLALWCATMALWVTPQVAFAQTDIIFTAPDLTVAPTDTTVEVPISFVTPTDVTLTGFRVELTYDATKLSVDSCTLVNTGFCNINTAGTIIFNGVGFAGIADGTVATIVFTIANGATGTSPLTMSLSQILDSSLTDITARATTEDGSITIQAGAVDVDDRMTRSIDYATVVFTGPTDPPSPSALLGQYELDFQFTYTGSGVPLSALYLQVNTATNSALLNADDGIGAVDSVLTIDDASLPGGDAAFASGEMLAVPMVIGVNAAGWVLEFDLMGIEQTVTVSSNESVQREVLLGRVVLTEEDLQNASQIYLPLVTSAQ